MKKIVLAGVVIGLGVFQLPAHAISESYRQQLENSGCTQVTENQGCNLNKSREWNERHGLTDGDSSNDNGREYGHRRHGRGHHNGYGRNDDRNDYGMRHEIEQFLNDSVIGEDVSDARQALYGYGCKRLGTDHWMKDDYEIRLNSFAGRVRSGRIVN